MRCTEIHETHIFLLPYITIRVGQLGSNAQNNANSQLHHYSSKDHGWQTLFFYADMDILFNF